jgi:hypothetical protein
MPDWGTPTRQATFYPLDMGRILGLAWSLFRFGWRTLLAIGLIAITPAIVLMAVVSPFFSPLINDWVFRAQVAAQANRALPAAPPGFSEAVLVTLLLTVVLVVAGLIASGALTVAANAMFRGQPISASQAVRVALRRFGALLGAELLYMVVVYGILLVGFVLGSVLIVVGGVSAFLGLVVIVGAVAALMFVSIRLSLLVQAIVLESRGPVDAFGRSWRLAAGSGWRILGYTVVMGLLSFVFGLAFQLITGLILRLDPVVPRDVLVGTLIDGIASILLLPLTPLIVTLLYYDLRFRQGEKVPLPGEHEAAQSAEPAG